MAGESPDKSKQQKSSGTARGESDPRLAVFREPPAGAETRGGTDTATAVFRTDSSGDGDVDGDARKADTATAVFRTRPSGDDEDGERDESPAARETSDDEASGDLDGSGAAVGAEGAEKAAQGPEKASEAPGPAESAVGTEGTEGTDAAEPAAAAEPEAGDARLRAAVAAWVSKDGDENGEGSKDAGDAKGATSERAAEPDTDAGADASDDDAPDGATVSGDDASDEARVTGSREKTSDTEDAEEVDGAEATAGAGDADKAESADDAAKAEDTDDAKRTDDAKDAAGAKDADDADDVDGEEKNDTSEGKRGGDQPTAVFRAPAAAKVDQPTTALKITRPAQKPDTESKPESAAERTSKFVPLRGDEVRPAPAPAPRKPEAPAAASAATAPAPALSTAERTTQQPMPPKPPLDLLAELTNTPPPPETPVRTAVRRVKIWTPLVLLLLIVFAIVQMVRPLPDPGLGLSVDPAYTFKGEGLNLSWPAQGQSAVSVDGVGSMGSAGAQKPAPIASVAKVMTAYVVLKDHPLTGKEEGEKITVDQQAEDESKREDESTAPITKGQQFTQKQLLQLLMIPSGNNAARLFARWDSPSEKEFVAKMNAAAKELGMTSTTYTDPSGLQKTTVSTAEDQLKLARAVMQNDVFREIVDTPQIKIPGIDQVIYNNNTILLEPGVSGIKTGSSTPAGGNLLWSANTVVDGKKLWIYGAVMGQQAGTGQPYDSLVMSLNNSLKLIKGAQKAVTSARVVKKGDVVGYVDDGLGGRTPVVATRDLKAKGWPGLKVELSVSDNGKKIPHDASAGTEVGVVTVGTGTGRVSAPVALQEDLKAPGFGQKVARIS
ncbi:serine hydrolase [Streptomyces sp. NPDC094048]|uniref:D-alanyl-D-alanine carboxypeptidase n=1 Tax=Streptomyces sp. NPDC094048 TaxID=3155207 RepID=UPI00332F9A99